MPVTRSQISQQVTKGPPPKRRSVVAKDLKTPKYNQRVVPSNKRKKLDKAVGKEVY